MGLPLPDSDRLRAAEGWLELGNWQEANAELEALEPLARAHPLTLALRVRIYTAAGRWESALTVGKSLNAGSHFDVELVLALSRAAAQLGDVEQGRKWVEQAMELNQTNEFKVRLLDDPLLKSIWINQT